MNERSLYAMPKLDQPFLLLGGLTPQQFMHDYWQKKPLLIRQALPNVSDMLLPQTLFNLARRDDVESRLISQSHFGWECKYGPFTKLPSLRRRDWTLLVQGVNFYNDQIHSLLRYFSFLPDARLDDVMVSYASPGGGVGPHFDSYDVFLLQIHGKREWQIAQQCDFELVPDLPLKILRHFKPEQTWVLAPGDMLYLPPHVAHNGTALDACLTASIGFRAPNYAELAEAFLGYLTESFADCPDFAMRYADPNQRAVVCPGELPALMVKQVTEKLRKITWRPEQVKRFLGHYLSEPKPNIFFDSPENVPTFAKFQRTLAKTRLALASRSRALYDKECFYLNGEMTMLNVSAHSVDLLPKLANLQAWTSQDCAQLVTDKVLLAKAYDWFSYGWLVWA